MLQQFDYTKQDDEKEFMVAVSDSFGQNIVIGSFDRCFILFDPLFFQLQKASFAS